MWRALPSRRRLLLSLLLPLSLLIPLNHLHAVHHTGWDFLNSNESTAGKVMAAAGYRTAHFGKVRGPRWVLFTEAQLPLDVTLLKRACMYWHRHLVTLLAVSHGRYVYITSPSHPYSLAACPVDRAVFALAHEPWNTGT